jgi:hypothetical protein
VFVTSTGAPTSGLRFTGSGTNSYIQWGSDITTAGAGTGNLFFTGINAGAPTSAFTILANGNVGVGTSAPSTLLHIQKGNYSTPANNTDGTSYGITFSSSNLAQQARVLCVDRTSSTGVWGGVLAFHTGLNGTAAERMRIDPTGLVCIGATNPLSRLDVADGDIRARSTATTNTRSGIVSEYGSVTLNSGAQSATVATFRQAGIYHTIATAGGGTLQTTAQTIIHYVCWNSTPTLQIYLQDGRGGGVYVQGSVSGSGVGTSTVNFFVVNNGSSGALRISWSITLISGITYSQ